MAHQKRARPGQARSQGGRERQLVDQNEDIPGYRSAGVGSRGL